MTLQNQDNSSDLHKQGKTLIVIVGPTGSGKTDLSIAVAKRFGAPIISTDSRQFFRGMAIGTAQPSPEQMAQVKHYFIADREIDEPQTCGKYEQEALQLLDELFCKHDVVVAVGGSGLYVDALCEGLDSLPDADPELRAELNARLESEGLEALCAQLEKLDPDHYQKIDRNNHQRVSRALEVCLLTGRPYSELRKKNSAKRDFRTIKIGVNMDREVLYERIDRRVDMMIEAGLESEARRLYPYRQLNSLQTVGYRELFDYFDGKCSREEAIELIKRNSRRYAKRQMTWFNRDSSIRWFDPRQVTEIEKYIENLLNHGK